METKFAVGIIGTGLVQSIVAAYLPPGLNLLTLSALTRLELGISVVHLDESAQYGGPDSMTFPLHNGGDLTSVQRYLEAHPATFSEITRLPPLSNSSTVVPLSNRQSWNVDLDPRLILSDTAFVKLLVSSGIGKYLEFKLLRHSFIANLSSEAWIRVPFSKEDVFLDKSTTLVEKRKLMKALFAIFAEASPEVPKDATLLSHLETQNITNVQHQNIILYSSLFLSTKQEAEHLSYAEGHERLQIYFRSLSRYGGKSPFLLTLYGMSELVQAFCRYASLLETRVNVRVSAVYGGVYMLNQKVACSFNDGAITITATSNEEEKHEFTVDFLISDSFPTTITSDSSTVSDSFQHRGVFLVDLAPEFLYLNGLAVFSTDSSVNSDSAIFVLPPIDDSAHAGYILLLGNETFHAPKNHLLVHVMLTSEKESENLAMEALSKLHFKTADSVDIDISSHIIDAVLFTKKVAKYSESSLENVSLIRESPPSVILTNDVTSQAEAIFRKCYAHLRSKQPADCTWPEVPEFLPCLPDPEL